MPSNQINAERRPFDVKIQDGRIQIYTSDWDEFGEWKWTAHIIKTERFKEIVKSYEDLLTVLKDKEAQELNEARIANSVCKMNREPNECSVNLYTENGCKTCHYFKKTKF